MAEAELMPLFELPANEEALLPSDNSEEVLDVALCNSRPTRRSKARCILPLLSNDCRSGRIGQIVDSTLEENAILLKDRQSFKVAFLAQQATNRGPQVLNRVVMINGQAHVYRWGSAYVTDSTLGLQKSCVFARCESEPSESLAVTLPGLAATTEPAPFKAFLRSSAKRARLQTNAVSSTWALVSSVVAGSKTRITQPPTRSGSKRQRFTTSRARWRPLRIALFLFLLSHARLALTAQSTTALRNVEELVNRARFSTIGTLLGHDLESSRRTLSVCAIRGILCGGCNRAIGFMKEDPAVLRAAADYLDSFSDL